MSKQRQTFCWTVSTSVFHLFIRQVYFHLSQTKLFHEYNLVCYYNHLQAQANLLITTNSSVNIFTIKATGFQQIRKIYLPYCAYYVYVYVQHALQKAVLWSYGHSTLLSFPLGSDAWVTFRNTHVWPNKRKSSLTLLGTIFSFFGFLSVVGGTFEIVIKSLGASRSLWKIYTAFI